MPFHGLLTALVTPFREDGLDLPALHRLVEQQIAGGVNGLVPCGTTGEAPTLDLDEHATVIAETVKAAAGRVPVMAGIGSNDTRTAILNAERAVAAGASGLLATAPYYNKPSQEGLYRHFRAIAEAVDSEVCVYNVPGRTAVMVEPETIARLAHIPNITCVKEATGDMVVASRILALCGDRFSLLSGDDLTTLPFIALGGHGCISVASNVVPARMSRLVGASLAGDLPTARAEHLALFPLFRMLFVETNPLPAKTALALMGTMEERFRLPLCEMRPDTRARLAALLGEYGLLPAESAGC